MRSVWATIFATWALFAVLALLAWTRPQPVVVNGTIPAAVTNSPQAGVPTSHATTRTSPVAAG